MAIPHKNSQSPPPMSVEARENQLIAMAMDYAEQQMKDGTASAAVISQLLKLGSSRERLALRSQLLQNDLTVAKTKSIESSDKMEQMYADAMRAFRRYSGEPVDDDDDEEL